VLRVFGFPEDFQYTFEFISHSLPFFERFSLPSPKCLLHFSETSLQSGTFPRPVAFFYLPRSRVLAGTPPSSHVYHWPSPSSPRSFSDWSVAYDRTVSNCRPDYSQPLHATSSSPALGGSSPGHRKFFPLVEGAGILCALMEDLPLFCSMLPFSAFPPVFPSLSFTGRQSLQSRMIPPLFPPPSLDFFSSTSLTF